MTQTTPKEKYMQRINGGRGTLDDFRRYERRLQMLGLDEAARFDALQEAGATVDQANTALSDGYAKVSPTPRPEGRGIGFTST